MPPPMHFLLASHNRPITYLSAPDVPALDRKDRR